MATRHSIRRKATPSSSRKPCFRAVQTAVSAEQQAALERLLAIAARDTGQSRRAAHFLLAWWNAGQCGGFDFTTMWGCVRAIVNDMAIVFAYVGHHPHYPDTLGYGPQFEAIVRAWRPSLVQP